MDPEATEQMCAYCFDVLCDHFRGAKPRAPSFDASISCPLFVTLKTISPEGSSLRGCIGTLSPTYLSSLADYSYSSAFRDRRFSPLAEYEVSIS